MTERQITALERMSSAALKAEWERLTGTPAPRISPSMMRLALAFEWRSRARGGYSRRLIDDRGAGHPQKSTRLSYACWLRHIAGGAFFGMNLPMVVASLSITRLACRRVHLHDIGASAREEHRQARHCDTLHRHRRGARAGCRACLTHRYGPDFAVRHCLSVNGSAESAIPCIERPPLEFNRWA